MTFSRDAIETSYGYCRRMSRRANSNFHAGFLLLPAEKRRAMEALYAFMRHTDDLTDAAPSDCSRRDALSAWRAALEEALQEEGKSESVQSSVGNSSFIIHHSSLRFGQSILPALADTVLRFHIPREHLDAVIDGVQMDLDRQQYETFDELQVYCERVASAVGLACIHVWGFRGPEAFPAARQAGIAMQLTNILRDLKQDAQAGRVYLPLADLRESGCSVDDLLAGVDDIRFRRLMAMEIVRAEQFYREGAKLWQWLDPDGRRIFGLMMATYRALLGKIARRPSDVFHGHVRLGHMKKLQLIVRWSLFPPRLEAEGEKWKAEGGGRRAEGGRPRAAPSPLYPLPSPHPSPLSALRLPPSTIAIIGGGLSGLAAAVAASQRGLHVELFEQAKSLGGRAGSFVDSQTGDRIDYCQHVALGCCTEFLDFCRRTDIEACFDRTDTLHFLAPDGTRHDFAPSRWLPAPLHMLPGMMKLSYLSWRERWSIVRVLRKLARTRDTGTIGQWLRGQGQSRRAIDRFWSVVLVSALGETIEHTSLSAAQQVFRDGFLASRGASDLVLPRRPLGEIFHDRLGRWLSDHGVRVHLETPVRQIEGDRQRAGAVVLGDGTRRAFDLVIVAVPWHSVRSLFGTDLLAAMPALAGVERIEPAAITAVHFWFDFPITALSHAVTVDRLGQWLFTKFGDAGVPGRVRDTHHDESGALHAPYEQYCQVVISASHRLGHREHGELLSEVRRELESIWRSAGQRRELPPPRLLHSRVVTQPAALFSCVLGLDRLRPPQQTPIENIALAGDWTATGWPATMESAIRSGYRAVDALFEGRRGS